ncbi:MAG: hypothetical protein WC307_01070 [Candidatus Nanoarchaeia archaeon]|jgi:predicted membrane protein (TIGR00267 family)
MKSIFSDEIVRRYFVMNTFDGVLTVIGILIALMLAGVIDTRIIFMSCIGSGIAMGVSGFWGAYLIERAERKYDIVSKGAKRTKKLIKQNNNISIIISLVDGLSPFIAMLLLIIPFCCLPVIIAYYISFIIAGVMVSFLGVFIARIGRDRVILSVLKMLSAAGVVILLIYLLELLKVV